MNTKLQNVLQGGFKNGDIMKYFEEMDNILEANSGVNDNKTLTADASDPPCPIDHNNYTKIKITDDAIHITNIDKSSLTAEVEVTIGFSPQIWKEFFSNETKDDSSVEKNVIRARTYRNMFTKWFVGLKASIQMFNAYRIYSGNKKTNCEQTEALYENAVVRILKPQEELDEKPFIYTTWKHANSGDDVVCGTYFTLNDIQKALKYNRQSITLRFELCVPLDDFVPLSAFTMYPNKVFENLSMELKLGITSNLVCCQVDPLTEFIKLKTLYRDTDDENGISECLNHLQGDIPTYHKHFVQLRDYFNSTVYRIDSNGLFYSETLLTSFSPDSARLMNLRSHINGFNVKDSVLNALATKYRQQPLIIPAQYCDYHTFSQPPNQTGIKCNSTFGMTNVSSLLFIFPRTPNEVTCSCNPHFDSIQIQVDNKPYPDKPFSTYEAAHTIFNLTNAGLDSLFSPSEEFAYSLSFKEVQNIPTIIDGNQRPENVMKIVNPTMDNTSYCFICSTERLSGYGNFCDGITKDSAHLSLSGTISGPYHPYYVREFVPETNRPDRYNTRPPIMIICQDCFWVFRTGETAEFVNNNKYFYDEQTGKYETSDSNLYNQQSTSVYNSRPSTRQSYMNNYYDEGF